MILCQDYQDGLIKLPIYDATAMVKGQGLIWGVDGSSTSTCAMIDVTNTAENFFAVLAETPANVATNIGTPTIYQATCQLVHLYRIWKIYYDLATGTDLDITSSTSTVVTLATMDDNLDGSWLYINSGTGAGQLRYIKAANTTTLTVNTAFTTTPDSTSDVIIIRNVGIPTGGTILNTTFDMMLAALDNTSAQKTIVLKNFCEGPLGCMELDITKNPHLETNGLNGRGIRFFSHVIFFDTIVAATGL